jgi:hypothetical protein
MVGIHPGGHLVKRKGRAFLRAGLFGRQQRQRREKRREISSPMVGVLVGLVGSNSAFSSPCVGKVGLWSFIAKP